MKKENVNNQQLNIGRDSGDEIDLIDLFFFLRNRFTYIIVAFVIGAVVAGCYTNFRIAPTYKANAYMYMVSASSDSIINLSDLNIGTSIAEDYQQLLVRRPILNNVIESVEGVSVEGKESENDILVLKDVTDLSKYVSLSILGSSRVLQIQVVTTNPKLSKNIANALAEQAVDYIPTISQAPAPTIAEYAVTPKHKFAPSLSKNTLVGGLGCMAVVMAYFVLIYLMDDSIHSEDELEKYFGIIAISAIPEGDITFANEEKEKKGGKK